MKKIATITLMSTLTLAGALYAQEKYVIPAEAEKAQVAAEEGLSGVEAAEKAVRSASTTTTRSTETTTNTETVTTKEEVAAAEQTTQGEGVMYNDGKMNYANSFTKFKLDAADSLSNVAYIEYRIDNSPFQTYQEPFNIAAEGLHNIVYRSVDHAGNYEAENVFPVIIDNTAPVVSMVTNEKTVVRDGVSLVPVQSEVRIQAIDRLSGVKKIEYSLNGAGYEDYTGEAIAVSAEEQYVLKYKAMDNLGNQTEERTLVVEADGTAPAVFIRPSQKTVNVNGKEYARRDTVFVVEAADKKSSVKNIFVKIDGEENFSVYSSPINFSEEGEHTIESKAVDTVGNESETVKVTFVTDDNPPKSVIQAITNEK